MSTRLEAYLARLYVNHEARRAFLAEPRAAAAHAGLAAAEIAALERIDRTGLELAARSFSAKRVTQRQRRAYEIWRTLLATTFGGVAWLPRFRWRSPSRRRWD